MQLTNKTNLPESIVQVITSFMNYSNEGSDFSVTQLIESPRYVQLMARHKDELTEDVSDLFWSFLGTMAHSALERHGEQFDKAEERLFVDIDGVRVSGKPDVYHDKKVIDYKLTSVWSVIKEGRSDKWKKQLNSYAWLFRQLGYEVDGVQILAMMRDWSKNKAKFEKDYPDTPIKLITIPLMPDAEIDAWVRERVAVHKLALTTSDADLPPCTAEDMWARDPQFAVCKRGETRAQRVFSTLEAATAFRSERGPSSLEIVFRPGQRVRCEEYCLVKDFCSQYQTYSDKATSPASKGAVQVPF